ncbi:tripartite motif-containing protein 45-like [Mytilus californianus]|uniref:tripartite motif-containing protein 45-like n=1 Tax=Mytilus californianus TaxID=6549 RepID=UPI002246ECD8|nr:tripartite motif-containing protein 45-like [Mytilus californianus]
MASNCSLCSVCDNRQTAKFSVVWCSECDEGLCGDCKEYHSISKDTKNHGTYSIAEHTKLPTELLQVAQVCKIHKEEYRFFCTKHDCPCCKKCKKSHKECKGLTDINEIIQEVKTSNAFYEIEQTLREVVENIKILSTNRKENLELLENKRRKIEAEIKYARTKVNHHLDQIQADLMKELMAVQHQESSKIQNVLSSLNLKEKEITELQVNIDNIKQKASDLQAFLTIKVLEKSLAVEEKNIQSIANSGIVNKVNISCQINQLLQQITASVSKFGEINVSSDPYQLPIQKQKDREAQIMLAVPTRNIGNLALTLQKRINTKLSDVQGCSLLPKGRMVFSCYEQEKIKVFKSNGSKDFEINDIGKVVDVVFIGDGCIAVTSGHSNKISIIDIPTKLM